MDYNEFTTIGTFNAANPSGLLKDLYEALVLKLLELSSINVAKAQSKGIFPGQVSIILGSNVATIFQSASAPSQFDVSELMSGGSYGRVYLETLRDGLWKIYLGRELPPNAVVVECNGSKALLTVHNLVTAG